MNQEYDNTGVINLTPNKPEMYDGRGDRLTVNTYLSNIYQYLSLAQPHHLATLISDLSGTHFASSYLKGAASLWWFNIVLSGKISNM